MRAAERAALDTQPREREAGPRTAALLDGQPITWDDLRPLLAEAAGGAVLQEVALDRLLAPLLASRGLSVTADDVAAERRLMIDTLVQEAAATPADAERLLARVRASRGLGDVRFARLLERNAGMRKIVAPEVEVSSDEIAQAFEMRHGAKYRVRVVVVPTSAQAAQLRTEIADAPGDRAMTFASAASKVSTDPSAARGGMSEPISTVDPAYPAAVRRTLRDMKPGDLSQVIALDRGYALLLLEEIMPPDGAVLADQADRIRVDVRARRERLAMDDLARRLLKTANLSPMDRSLAWSLRGTAISEP